eukprot:GDKK01064118.1.p1 GENE.GDKK01064118.1~~GDKK01064118.1.p1  ORF type:complete len:173 (+),score=28.03 GDKK01064118.1:39-557(+)
MRSSSCPENDATDETSQCNHENTWETNNLHSETSLIKDEATHPQKTDLVPKNRISNNNPQKVRRFRSNLKKDSALELQLKHAKDEQKLLKELESMKKNIFFDFVPPKTPKKHIKLPYVVSILDSEKSKMQCEKFRELREKAEEEVLKLRNELKRVERKSPALRKLDCYEPPH